MNGALHQKIQIESQRQTVVVTVHGTWARRAPWAQEGSALARSVARWFADQGVATSILPFEWSGRNSISARRRAGVHLAELLTRIRDEHPRARIYVIAHSHGGSVFAYAATHRPDIVLGVNGFIALATPWIGARPCTFAEPLRSMLLKLVLYPILLLLIAASYLVVGWAYFGWVGYYRQARGSIAQSWAFELGQLLGDLAAVDSFAMLATAALGVIAFFFARGYLSHLVADRSAAFEANLRAFADQITTLHVTLPNSVFLKPTGDEAALALTWPSAMAALMHGGSTTLFWLLQSIRECWMLIPRWLQVVGGTVLTAGWGVGAFLLGDLVMAWGRPLLTVLRGAFDWTDLLKGETLAFLMFDLPIAWSVVSSVIVVALSAVLLALILIASLAAVGAGSLSPRAALFLEFSVEAIPTGSHRLVLIDVTPDTPTSGRIARSPLSHSALYGSLGAIHAVIEALESFCADELTSA
jgi:pimeloyl-ACP methyl ester carboxylesterase